jgi:hypothetical protein
LTGNGLAMSCADVTRPRSTLYINDAAGLTSASDVGRMISYMLIKFKSETIRPL